MNISCNRNGLLFGPLSGVLMLLGVLALLPSCGYKGEPLETYAEIDTVVNDMSYTAVTSGLANLSAVGVNLKGFANMNTERNADRITEQGFLVSRFSDNPSYDAADLYPPNDKRFVLKIPVKSVANDNSIRCRVTGLIPNTKFYYRAYVVRDGQPVHGVTRVFKTTQLGLSISPSAASRGLSDAMFSGQISNIADEDYDAGVSLCFRIQDAPFDADSLPSFKEDQESFVWKSASLRYAKFSGLVPGGKYYVRAFANLPSPFFCFEEDNPQDPSTGKCPYGRVPQDVFTDRFVTQYIDFKCMDLNGVAVYSCGEPSVDYDLADFVDCYFVLPSDTLQASEYGVAFVITNPDGTKRYTYYPSSEPLRVGNRFSVMVNGLPLKSSYTYVAYAVVKGLMFYSHPEVVFTTKDYEPHYVDLGLPSGLLWADRNVGAYAPEVFGHYYAWGEVASKRAYSDANYGGPSTMQGIAGSAYDAALAKWGEPWRMPTPHDVDELFAECDLKWGSVNGVRGLIVKSLANDNSIFLPAAGLKKEDGKTVESGAYCHYWTDQRVNEGYYVGLAYDFYYANGIDPNLESRPVHMVLPAYGLTIRPVRSK